MYKTLVQVSIGASKRPRPSYGSTRSFIYAYAVGALICMLVGGCSPDRVTVWSTQARSPDGQWIATGRSDQYSGPGNAAIVSGVYLRRADGSGPEEAVLHYLDEFPAGKGGIEMTLAWVTPTHLQVTFNRPPQLNLLVVKYAGIEISVRDPQSS